jgi:3-oxoacyl-[acyl-carrier-protein] synthase II
MKAAPFPLTVLGRGAVTPGGCSVAALDRALGEPAREPLLSDPARTAPVRRVDSAALDRWSLEPRLRRASPLALYLAEVAQQALANVPTSVPAIPLGRLGLVAALGTGSIGFSRRFYERLLDKGRAQAAPVVFPETVYNSPVSHVAALLGIGGACYTLVGDESAWVEALRVAQTWLACGTADAVLVLGGEELDAIALEAYARFGWFRRGVVATEGAGAVLVGRPSGARGETLVVPVPVAISFRSQREQQAAWRDLIADSPVPVVLPANIVAGGLATELMPNAVRLGPDLGFAFTASTAWSFLRACDHHATAGPFRLLVPGTNAAVAAVDFL